MLLGHHVTVRGKQPELLLQNSALSLSLRQTFQSPVRGLAAQFSLNRFPEQQIGLFTCQCPVDILEWTSVVPGPASHPLNTCLLCGGES